MSILKKISLLFLIIFGLFYVFHPALAQRGTELFKSNLFVSTPAQGAGGIIVNIVMWMMSIIALLALGFIVFGAIRYVTSAGNEKMVEEAKKIILYAIIGLVIAILAIVIIQLVANTVQTGGMEVACCKVTTGSNIVCTEDCTKQSICNSAGTKCEPYYCSTGQTCGSSGQSCSCVTPP